MLTVGNIVQKCKRPSEGSSRRSHFYELDVQVQSMESLQHSLVRASLAEGGHHS